MSICFLNNICSWQLKHDVLLVMCRQLKAHGKGLGKMVDLVKYFKESTLA